MLVDEFLPVYDVSDTITMIVDADVAITWAALKDVDLIEVGRPRPIDPCLFLAARVCRDEAE